MRVHISIVSSLLILNISPCVTTMFLTPLYHISVYKNTIYYRIAVVPGYYLVCYNKANWKDGNFKAVVPGYYLVCYNTLQGGAFRLFAVVPGYYLVCYN